jgi:putative solute:sodium symporter small subunit
LSRGESVGHNPADSLTGAGMDAERLRIRMRYWRRVQQLTGALLAVWLLTTLIGPWFARKLSGIQIAGFPLSFWVASQGALLIYIGVVAVYAVVMDRLDAAFARELHRLPNADE